MQCDAMQCYAVLCYAMLRFACFALLGLALLCLAFALRRRSPQKITTSYRACVALSVLHFPQQAQLGNSKKGPRVMTLMRKEI